MYIIIGNAYESVNLHQFSNEDLKSLHSSISSMIAREHLDMPRKQALAHAGGIVLNLMSCRKKPE